MDPERRRRNFTKKSYMDCFSDAEELIINASRKPVPIGSNHQIEVAQSCTFESLPDPSEYEELLWDPRMNPKVLLSEFYSELHTNNPLIKFEDELVMELYMKYNGDINMALKDKDAIEKMVNIQASPLTNWSVEECLEFKNALLRYGKRFNLVCQNCYPHRSVKNIVEFYYIWKKSPLFDEYEEEVKHIKERHESMALDGMENPIDLNVNGHNSKSSNDSESPQFGANDDQDLSKANS